MSDLVAFLRARLDEDEASATPGRGALDDLRFELKRGTRLEQFISSRIEDGLDIQTMAWEARALREAAAKRAILDAHAPSYPTTYPEPSGQPACSVCHAGGWDWEPEKWPCATVRALAAVYSGHPDYRPEWAVQPRS